jgi:hypothetical protein
MARQKTKLEDLGDSITNATGGIDPTDPARAAIVRNRLQQSDPNITVEPPKPDPEATANSLINAAVNKNQGNMPTSPSMAQMPPGLPAGMTMEQARQTMNPATGLPYSANQASSLSQDDQNLKNAMRLQWLKQQAGQGQ